MKKKCTKCGEVKSLMNFSKSKAKKDNLQSWCKKCVNHMGGEYGDSQLIDIKTPSKN